MKNVGDGEVVAEGGDDEGDGGEKNESENYDAGAASGFAQALPTGSPGKKRATRPTPNEYMLSANARSKAKLPICAMRENPDVFFQKRTCRQPEPIGRPGQSGIRLGGSAGQKDSGSEQRIGQDLGKGSGRSKRFRESGGRGSAAKAVSDAAYALCWW